MTINPHMVHKTKINHTSKVSYICESCRNASDPENTGFNSLHKVYKVCSLQQTKLWQSNALNVLRKWSKR